MAKNYTIEYLSALHQLLEDEAAGILSTIDEADTGEGDMPSDGKSKVKSYVALIQANLNNFETDVPSLTYTQFKEKYLEHL
jgi:hypothetical protein